MPRIYNAPVVSVDADAFFAEPYKAAPERPRGLASAADTVGKVGGIAKAIADSPLTGLAIRGAQAVGHSFQDYARAKLKERSGANATNDVAYDDEQAVAPKGATAGAVRAVPTPLAPFAIGSDTQRANDLAMFAAQRAGAPADPSGRKPTSADDPIYAEHQSAIAARAQGVRNREMENSLAAESAAVRARPTPPPDPGSDRTVAEADRLARAAVATFDPSAARADTSEPASAPVGSAWRASGGAPVLPPDAASAEVSASTEPVKPVGSDWRAAGGTAGLPVVPQRKTLGTATDAELATLQTKLDAMLKANPANTVARQRLDQVLAQQDKRDAQQELDASPAPLSEDEWLQQVKLADTPEKQAKVLGLVDRVRAPITSFEDLIGNGPRDRLLKQAQTFFGQVPTTTPEAQAALLEVNRAKAAELFARGDKNKAGADRIKELVDEDEALLRAKASRQRSEGDRAGAQAGTEAHKQGELDARRDKELEQAADLKGARPARIANLEARSKALADRVAILKAKRAGGGGGKTSDALKDLKLLVSTSHEIVKEANDAEASAIKEAEAAQENVKREIAKAADVKAPSATPPAPATTSDPAEKAQRAAALDKWNADKAAYDAAQARVTRGKRELEKAQTDVADALAAKRVAQAAAAELKPAKAKALERVNKKMGVAPAPKPPTAEDRLP